MMDQKIIKEVIKAKGIEIAIYTDNFQDEYISLTDIAKYKSNEPKDVVKNWMRRKDTLEFLGLWEYLHNEKFKGVEFDSFKIKAGSNAFTMSPQKWIEATDAIKENIIPKLLSSKQIGMTYANEADVLNVALFEMTAKNFREKNPEVNGNMRDFATLNQLLVLANLESYNAVLIEQGISQSERL